MKIRLIILGFRLKINKKIMKTSWDKLLRLKLKNIRFNLEYSRKVYLIKMTLLQN